LFSVKCNKIIQEEEKKKKKKSVTRRLEMPYLVQFGFLVGKERVAISLGVVVIHKHKSITMRNETPLLP
jgi:hypothetical protein